MELDITRFFLSAEPAEFSGSVAERGPNAGPQTWQNAKREAAESPLLTTDAELEEFRDYMGGFGAWDDAARAAWTPDDCNALLIQLISGDMREAGADDCFPDEFDWVEYEKRSQAGEVAGRMFRGIDGLIYYYIGS